MNNQVLMNVTGKIMNVGRGFPLHCFLLPLFFVLTVHNRFAGLLTPFELFKAWLFISLGMLVVFTLFFFIYKTKVNAGIATTLAGIVFLFFGEIKQGLAATGSLFFISQYRILLPLLAFFIFFMSWRLYKSRPMGSWNYFFNLLLIIYLGIEAWNFFTLTLKRSKHADTSSLTEGSIKLASTPGIYYIVPDSYPSSRFQQEVLGAGGNELDSLLRAKGFYIVSNARSNYNTTAFSMAALFQMDYPEWLNGILEPKPYHYNRAIEEVKESAVIHFLQQQGYRLYNLSIFDLPGRPSVKKEKFLSATSAEIIYYNTLWQSLNRNLAARFFPAAAKRLINRQEKQNRLLWGGFKTYNKLILDSITRVPSNTGTAAPHFTYAHLAMPHAPYFYDSAGNPFPDELVYGPLMIRDKKRFSHYTAYTNSKLAGVADSLLRRSDGRDIIIIQSDHGINSFDKSRKNDAFSNYTAIYFPERDYKELYPAMSNVNTFRIIFNKYFGQQLPLLKDSTIYLE